MPKEANLFKDTELRDSGLWFEYVQPAHMADNHFKLLVLLALQSRELRKRCDDLHQQVEELTPYHSPLWEKLHKEPDPLKQQAIRAAIDADEKKEAQRKAAKKKAFNDSLKLIMECFGKKTWKSRDRKHVPFQAVLWHEPMTVNDYHEATGISARQLQNVLRRLKAEPLQAKRARKRKNEPLRYGVETNMKVLCEWLIRYIKDPGTRRAWLVKTCLKCKHEAAEHLDRMKEAIMPALLSLNINSGETLEDFVNYVKKVDQILYPPVMAYSMDPFTLSAMATLNSIGQ